MGAQIASLCCGKRAYLAIGSLVAIGLFCGERACPALGREAALKPENAVPLDERGDLDGAAAQPNAGQARSPQRAPLPQQARSPQGCWAAAPSALRQVITQCLGTCGPSELPLASMLPVAIGSLWQWLLVAIELAVAIGLLVAIGLFVVSGLVPRWGAERP